MSSVYIHTFIQIDTHHNIALEIHGLGHRMRQVPDGDLFLLPHRQNKRIGSLFSMRVK